MKDDHSFLRMGGAAAVVGGVLAAVGNVLHPRWTDLTDVDLYRKIGDNGIWKVDHLILVLALILTIAGTVAIAHALEGKGNDGLAYFGRLAVVIGGAIALAQIAIDTFAIREQAEAFAHATRQDQVSAFWAVNTIDHVQSALFNMWTVVLLGLAPVLLGAAAIRTRRFPAWLGWAAVVGGVVCGVVGFAGLITNDQDPFQIPFLVGSLLVTVWILGAGWVLWRGPDAPLPADTVHQRAAA